MNPVPGAPRRILVIDDNQDIRAFMHAALAMAGYEVQTASEGAEGLALLRRQPVDLLIVDIFMPGQEGMETIARCVEEFPGMRIIAMSAGGRTAKHDYLAAAALIGADTTLRKPFEIEQLLAAVRGLLQPSRT